MKNIYILLWLIILLTACNSDIKSPQKQEQQESDTIEVWFPEKPEIIETDTIINIANQGISIHTEYFSLENENVQFDYNNGSKYYIYHYREYGVKIKININDSLIIEKSVRKTDLKKFIGPDLMKEGILSHVEFVSFQNDEFLFNLDVIKPESDYFACTKLFINLEGQTRMEMYPEEYYEME